MIKLNTEPLTRQAFAPFGDVIEKADAQSFPINNGHCIRFHDLANIETIGDTARTMISIFSSKPSSLPLHLEMVERHPLGSQAFVPLSKDPFLVIACKDNNGTPDIPQAFIATNWQGINFKKNTWHGVLTPLVDVSDFLVVDRGGEGNNLEEFFFDEPYVIGSKLI